MAQQDSEVRRLVALGSPSQDDPALAGFTQLLPNMSAADRCLDAACVTLGFDLAEVRQAVLWLC
jgi:hypothetical protein